MNQKSKEIVKKIYESIGKLAFRKSNEEFYRTFGNYMHEITEQDIINVILEKEAVKNHIERAVDADVIDIFEKESIDEIEEEDIAKLAQIFCDEMIDTIEYKGTVIYPRK